MTFLISSSWPYQTHENCSENKGKVLKIWENQHTHCVAWNYNNLKFNVNDIWGFIYSFKCNSFLQTGIPHSPNTAIEGIMMTCEYQNIVSESGQISSTPSSGPVAFLNMSLKYMINVWRENWLKLKYNHFSTLLLHLFRLLSFIYVARVIVLVVLNDQLCFISLPATSWKCSHILRTLR